MAYLTFHKWLVSVCNIYNDIMNGTNQNQSLGKSELRYYFIRLTIYEYIQTMNLKGYSQIQTSSFHGIND